MTDSAGRISQIGVAVPVTPPKDPSMDKTAAFASSRTMGNQHLPPPSYPGLPVDDGFQNIPLEPMNAAEKELPTLPCHATPQEFDIKYFKPKTEHRRRFYIAAIVILALILIAVSSSLVVEAVDHHQQPAPQNITTTATSIQSTTQITTVPTTVLSVSIATPTLTTVVSTTTTNFSFGITALPPSATPAPHTTPPR